MDLNQWSQGQPQPITTEELDELGKKYQAAWENYEVKKKETSAYLEVAEEQEAKLLNALKLCGKTKYFVEGLGTFSRINKLVVRTPKTADEKWAVLKYAESRFGTEGRDALISVNHQAINGFYNRESEAAAERGEVTFSLPGVGEPTSVESLRFTKAK
jgi:hypothetical protein